MSALTGPRAVVFYGEDKAVVGSLNIPLKAGVVVFDGALVVLIGGYGKPGVTGLGLVAAGFADHRATTSGSVTGGAADGGICSNGSLGIRVRQGVGKLGNSSSTDQITQADRGNLCYIVDDQTVAKTDGGGTRSVAGVIMSVDAAGVDVSVNMQTSLAAVAQIQQQNGIGNADEVSASGALSAVRRTSRLAVSGTKAYTLPNGITPGQRKTLFCVSAAATPVGVVTPANASGFTTITFGAGSANSSVELEWDSSLGTPAWKVVGVVTVGTLTIA